MHPAGAIAPKRGKRVKKVKGNGGNPYQPRTGNRYAGLVTPDGWIHCGLCGKGERLDPLNYRQFERWTPSGQHGAVHKVCLRKHRHKLQETARKARALANRGLR